MNTPITDNKFCNPKCEKMLNNVRLLYNPLFWTNFEDSKMSFQMVGNFFKIQYFWFLVFFEEGLDFR